MSKTGFILTGCLLLMLAACKSPGDEEDVEFKRQGRAVPQFSAGRAYHYIEDQVHFGPRVPNSEAHTEAKDYFQRHFQETAGSNSVYVQTFQQVVYGDTLTLHNILASFGATHTDRIVLAAHWDSRPRSEQDENSPEQPVTGADDGGSGAGVLLELANIFADHKPPVGVDIILFDGEDYGETSDLNNYFLGSRYWGNNPPVPGYSPRFGILLDMVGGRGAEFPKERYSISYHPALVNEIWSLADAMDYSHIFVDERGGYVSDDHVIVNNLTGIAMINIISHRVDPDGNLQFPPYWHTANDDMDIIDKETLQAVGDVLLELIYNRISL